MWHYLIFYLNQFLDWLVFYIPSRIFQYSLASVPLAKQSFWQSTPLQYWLIRECLNFFSVKYIRSNQKDAAVNNFFYQSLIIYSLSSVEFIHYMSLISDVKSFETKVPQQKTHCYSWRYKLQFFTHWLPSTLDHWYMD